MRTTLAILLALLMLPALGGCKKQTDKAQEALKDAASRLSNEYEESKVLAHVREVLQAVESRDLERLKTLCTDPGNADYSAIMGCYYDAFAIEDRQGVDAARKYLADELAKQDTPPANRKAVQVLDQYFVTKGTLRTREVAGLILIVALEAKYPHRGGLIGELIARNLGMLPPSTTPTQPASSPSTSNPARGE